MVSRSRLFVGLIACCSSSLALGAPLPESCQRTAIPGKVFERQNSDIYRSAKIEGGNRLVVFSPSPPVDVLRGRKIVDEEPTIAVALLSDGSALSFDRDCRGVRCVYLGLKVASRATDCWEWLSGEKLARSRNTSGEFVLGAHVSIAVENTRGRGRLLLRTLDVSGQPIVEPLIVTTRPIVGFGVSVPSIHGGIRNIDVIKREKDGSLSLATYTFVNW